MKVFHSSAISLRLCAALAFISYLLAGASFALPTGAHCARCNKLTAAGTPKPGASCPLAYHGQQHCHEGHGKSPGKITLCPDGCLRHDGQGGEIPSPAKFLSAPAHLLLAWTPTDSVSTPIPVVPPETFLPPPDHPPSLTK